MRRTALHALASGLLLACVLACRDAGNQFRVIPLAEAQTRIHSGHYTVVEAAPGAAEDAAGPTPEIHWEVPLGSATKLSELPPGPLLIVAGSRAVGYRSAAAAARTGRGDVLLFISESAEERRTLYAPLASKGATS